MSEWWQGVEDALAAHSAEAPDPWADEADELPMLTEQQKAFLEQIAAQPQPDAPDEDESESATWRIGRRPD